MSKRSKEKKVEVKAPEPAEERVERPHVEQHLDREFGDPRARRARLVEEAKELRKAEKK